MACNTGAVDASALETDRYFRWRLVTRQGDSWTARSYNVHYSWWVLV